MRPVYFFVVLGALLAGLFMIQRPLPAIDIFSAIPEGARVRLANPTEPELYAAKLAHGRLAPRRNIGLFGNSRSLMVGATHLGTRRNRFFNFAVPGSSFRTSVSLAEDLARAGKLPNTVLVSLDHLEIQFDGNPNIRGLGGWVGRLVRDLRAGLNQRKIRWRTVARVAWRHIYVGSQGLARYFNAGQLAEGVRWRFRGKGPRAWWLGTPISGGSGYKRDGSRAAGNVTKQGKMAPMSRAAPMILIDYLVEDLRRLAALRRRGARIIVYESPLHGSSAKTLTQQPSPHATEMRRVFLRACKRLGLECYGHAPEAPLAAAPGWTDPTHPPAAALAGYLRGLLAQQPQPLPRQGSLR